MKNPADPLASFCNCLLGLCVLCALAGAGLYALLK